MATFYLCDVIYGLTGFMGSLDLWAHWIYGLTGFMGPLDLWAHWIYGATRYFTRNPLPVKIEQLVTPRATKYHIFRPSKVTPKQGNPKQGHIISKSRA